MFVDALVIDPTRSFYVARRGTMALPMVAAMNLCGGACLFRKGSDRKALYDTIHRWYKQGRIPIVYPEGTRNPTLRRLPLKLGMVKLAYDRDIPIVIYISSGKERVINESVFFIARELTKVETRMSDVLTKENNESLDDYITRVCRVWNQMMDDTPGYANLA